MKTRKLFSCIKNGQFYVGWAGHYMTKAERCRFLWRHKKQKGRAVA